MADSRKAAIQEEQYKFPYHYCDLIGDPLYKLVGVGHRELVRRVKELALQHGKRILDVGCGDGRFIYELQNEKCDAVGVDYSERAIGFARAFSPKALFYARRLEDLDIEKKFDVVVMMETLEHIEPKAIPTVMKNLHGLLKPKGTLIITVPSQNLPIAEKHYQHFSPESLSAAVSQHFATKAIEGYRHKTTYTRFIRKMKIAQLLQPLQLRIKAVRSYFASVDKFYRDNVARCAASEGLGLIGVFEKK